MSETLPKMPTPVTVARAASLARSARLADSDAVIPVTIPAQGRRGRSPAAAVRTAVTVPLRFADGYATTGPGLHLRRAGRRRGAPGDRPRRLAAGAGPVGGRRAGRRWSGRTASASPATCSVASGATAARSCGRPCEQIAGVGGFLLYLRQEGRGIGLYAKLDAYALQDAGLDTYEANVALGRGEDERDYTVAAQMLRALGADRVRAAEQQPGQGRTARPRSA